MKGIIKGKSEWKKVQVVRPTNWPWPDSAH